MNTYVIATDSTADLTAEQVKLYNIPVIPMPYIMNDKEYSNTPDHKDMSLEEFYTLQKSGVKINTSATNTTTIYELLKPYAEKGKDILYIAFSSGLSVTCNNGIKACEELRSEFSDLKIIHIDSKAASMGQGLLAYLAKQKQNEGATIEETAEFVENHIDKLAHWFTVDDLHHLKRGGRVSAVTALVGSALQIKPVLHVDNEGKLIPVAKVRGRKQSLEFLVQKAVETATKLSEQTVFISHAACKEDAEYTADLFKKLGNVKEIVIGDIGPVIGTHAGAGTVAVFFLASHK